MIATDKLVVQRQIYNFLRTVTIKYAPIAQYINANLLERGYEVNDLDPTSWKYYLNMVGTYHVSDTPMYVMSIDTRTQILFSKENLANHPRTRSVYVPGGQYYSRLCETYPGQEDLIKSILFPVEDITKAITAPDLTILQFGSGYLETYEENPLVEGLRAFLKIIHTRWYFEFLDDEPLFHVKFFGGLWTKMAAFLLTEREAFIHTPYVHSWHIWNHLRDAGLNDYSDILNREKSMMLYQNMDYFKSNAGKMSNLAILANRLLDDFGISIYARRVVQESETGADKYQLTPQLEAVRIPINTRGAETEIGSETVATIQSRAYDKGFAIDNSPEAAAAKERELSDTTLNDFLTKFLEIRPIARNKVYADILNVFLLETLTTSIVNDHYRDPVLVNDIATGAVLYLYPKELLALYHYASLKSIGIVAENIPDGFFLHKAFNTQIGTPAKTIKIGDEKIYISMYVDAASHLSELNYDTNLASPSEFSEMASRLWLRYMHHLLEDTQSSIETKRQVLAYLSDMCHTRRIETHDLVPGYDSYERWLGPEGIDIQASVLAQYDLQSDPQISWSNLADSIISALIPMTDTLNAYGNYTLTDFGYERLRQLFIQMCSYKVVFLESTRTTPNFSNGGKWSHRYGPDQFSSFSDYIVTHTLNTVDTTTFNEDMVISPGFIKDEVFTTRDAAEMEGYMETTILRNDAASAGSVASPLPKNISEILSVGTLDLTFSSMVVSGIEEDNTESALIDIDNIPIIDSDGSPIIDPNV